MVQRKIPLSSAGVTGSIPGKGDKFPRVSWWPGWGERRRRRRRKGSHLRTSKGFPMTSLAAQIVKHLPTMRKTRVRSLGREDPPGEGNGNPPQYSCLGNPTDGGAWWATAHGVAKRPVRLSH